MDDSMMWMLKGENGPFLGLVAVPGNHSIIISVGDKDDAHDVQLSLHDVAQLRDWLTELIHKGA